MNYHNITKCDIVNGMGIRVVLWVAGCEHHCKNCHNPTTWNPDDGLLYTEETQEELMEALDHDWIAGITFSGGDPLHPKNRLKVAKIIFDVKNKFPDKDVWVYTGYTWDEIKHLTSLLKNIDVLVDGEFVEDLKDITYPWAGSTNQRVIDVKATLEEGEIKIYQK